MNLWWYGDEITWMILTCICNIKLCSLNSIKQVLLIFIIQNSMPNKQAKLQYLRFTWLSVRLYVKSHFNYIYKEEFTTNRNIIWKIISIFWNPSIYLRTSSGKEHTHVLNGMIKMMIGQLHIFNRICLQNAS